MDSQRTETINGIKVEEYYWNGKVVVYVDNQKVEGTFEDACKAITNGDEK